ncbi:MAG: CHAT domain-containing protein [Saprospiraceae bacterium]|nr:CHAT domain-containing protein [Saprospiraceae bacterium]
MTIINEKNSFIPCHYLISELLDKYLPTSLFKFIIFILIANSNMIYGQCEDLFVINNKAFNIHELVTKQINLGPRIQLMHIKKHGIVIGIHTSKLLDKGDKLIFLSEGYKHSFDIIDAKRKKALKSNQKFYMALAQIDINNVRLFTKNRITEIRLFNRSKMIIYPYKLKQLGFGKYIDNPSDTLKNAFNCFYETLDKQLINKKEINPSLNKLSNKVIEKNEEKKLPAPEYCANIISPTIEGEASVFIDIIDFIENRDQNTKDFFDCKLQFISIKNGLLKANLTTSRTHQNRIKNMQYEDALVFVSVSKEKKLFKFKETPKKGENLAYKFYKNTILLNTEDLKWLAENDIQEIRIADMKKKIMYPYSLKEKNTERLRTTAQCFSLALNASLLADKEKVVLQKDSITNNYIPPVLEIEHHFHHSHRIWDINDLHLSTEEASKRYENILAKELSMFKDSILRNIILKTEIGIAFYEQKYYDRAIAFFHETLKSIEDNNTGIDMKPQIETMLATMYLKQKKYKTALKYNLNALSVWRNGVAFPDDWDYAFQAYLNHGKILKKLDDSDKNIVWYEKSVASGKQDWEKEVKKHHPDGLLKHKIPEKSINMNLVFLSFKNAEVLIHKIDNHDQINKKIEILMEIGKLFFDAKDINNSKKYYASAQKLISKYYHEHHPKYASLKHMLSQIALQEKSFEKAISYVDQIIQNIEIDESLVDNIDKVAAPINILKAITTKGIITYEKNKNAHTKGALDKVLENYEIASKILIEMRKTHLNEGSDYQLEHATDKLSQHAVVVCNELYQLTNDNSYLEKSYNFAELSKSGTPYEIYQDLKSAKGIPKEEIDKENNLKTQLSNLKDQLFYELQQGNSKDLQKINELKKAIAVVNTEHKNLIEAFKTKYPKYHALKYNNETTSLSDLQKSLHHNEVFLEYTATDSFIYVLAISKKDIKSQYTNLKSSLSSTVKTLQYALKENNALLYYKFGYKFYNSVIGELANFIQNKKLIIAPDAELYYIPFGVLPTKKKLNPKNDNNIYTNSHFLIHDHPICYNHSAHDFVKSKSITHTLANHQIATWAPHFETMGTIIKEKGYGDAISPLPGAEKEAYLIADLFDNQAHIANDASEVKFKQKSNQYSILHIATHGLVNNVSPLSSGLVLSNEGNEDGILNAGELYEMNLNAELAVLSACNSGMGKLVKAKGIIGVASGFTYAGVPNIVTSKWSVSDWSTLLIMKYFYINLKTGMPKDEALQLSKIKYLNDYHGNENLSAPYFWGAFVLNGNTNPIEALIPLQKKYWFLLITSLFFVAIVFIFLKWSKLKRK